ncbi:hypothetical protein AQUCO_10200011v1 [Aquilegia coerulea]|uniref:RNA ligase/cyclic nucleotide phosphodiesterase family protein n=1 Tax=Aquilegia coerulea TaxID=218851 RepID=A0A2G5C569_AQUCA|nr:hypothetical protein AQUCO_10200011v1 [Aquilegia coerulea]
MESSGSEISATTETQKNVYSVWGIPSKNVTERLKKLMENLRSEFGGPEFEPHVTVVGAIQLTQSDAIHNFNLACQGVKPYTAKVNSVSTGTFFYQCVYLLLHPSNQVLEASAHCSRHFGYLSSSPYMPHASLLYGDITVEEKQRAKEKAEAFDAGVSSLSFQISRLALYKTDPEDKTLKSWEKIADYDLV